MRFIGLTLVAIGCTAVSAQPFQWTTYTSTSSIVDLLAADGHLWASTTGGLFDFNPVDGTFDVYNNTRGLAMNQCNAVGRDNQGWIWAGAEDGRITRLDPATGAVRLIFDLQNDVFEINAILGVGDHVFVAANNGIYRFSYRDVADNYRVLESIRVLGSFPGETRVAALAARDGYLYAATGQGIARASLATESLSAPSAWTNFTVANAGLPQNAISTLYAGGSGLWVASSDYVFTFTNATVEHAAMLAGIKTFADAVNGLAAASNNTVYLQSAGNPDQWNAIGQGVAAISRIASVNDGTAERLIMAQPDNYSARGGLRMFVNDQWSEPLRAEGIGGNLISAVGVSPGGEVWVGGKNFVSPDVALNGVYRMQDEQWEIPTRSEWVPGRPLNDIQGFAFDQHGGVWISTYGSGVALINGANTFYYNRTDTAGFSTEGPRFAGIPGDPQFIVTRVSSSPRGDVYISDRGAVGFLPVVRVGAEWIASGYGTEPWNYFSLGTSNSDREVEALIADQYDRVWVAASRDGTNSYVLNYNGTPDNPGDDDVFSYNPANYEDAAYTCFDDINKEAVDYEIDQQGYLWAATPQGAYYSQGGIPADLRQLFFVCVADLPVGTRVNDIHVDAQDNKWFATDEGVAVLDHNFRWVHVFRTSADTDNPSDLAAKTVNSIASNPATGDVWIGTSDGLSRLRTPYVARGNDLDELWPYPNPFRADGTQHMFVDHQRLGARFDEFRVFTVSGRLVRKLSWEEMINPQRGWDGRNDDGELVAGGVYLLVAATDGGSSATGKIAVLGR
jgi:ligand-binding sensor domain-containing protein